VPWSRFTRGWEGVMTAPVSGRPVAFIQVSDREQALSFYRNVLGLTVRNTDLFGVFLKAGSTLVRMTAIPNYQPHAYPVFGWNVDDIVATVRELKARGIEFVVYEDVGQDELGVWTAPDGKAKVAWFKDPDGNLLSVSQG
jgi:catechol 2,3-dioxygenase-like lactoylglutathione lyase family enzyme